MEIKAQPKLYSTETGEAIQASPDEISSLVSSGKAAFKKGEIIPVVDASGKSSTIPAEEFGRALTEGFSYEPLDSQHTRALKDTYGDQPIRASLEGAARGLTLGLSDVGLRAVGADAEGMAARKEYNPIASMGSEVVGAIAPVLLSGGAGAAAEGANVARAGAEGTSLLRGAAELAPTSLVAKVGTGVTRGVEKAIGSEGAQTLAGKIVRSAVPMAAGSAVEGAIYSAGNVLSEAALGDPDISAEKAIAQIGMGAALGGALGGLVGAVAAPFKKAPGHFVSELDKEVGTVAQATDMAVASPLLDKAETKAMQEGVGGIARHADDVNKAGELYGVQVFPEQVTSSGAKKSASAILDNSVSPTAIARNNMKQDAIRTVVGGVEDTVGKGLEVTEQQAGNQMKTQLKAKFDAAYEPAERLYKVVSENLPHVEVGDKAKAMIASNIRKLDGYKVKGSLTQKYADFILDNLGNIKTAKDALNVAQELGALPTPGNTKERFIAGVLKEKLDNLVESSTLRAADKLIKETGDQGLKATLEEVVRAIPQAKKEYAGFRDVLDTFAKQLGRKRISGKAGMEEFLEELSANKLMDRMFGDKKDPRFLKFLVEKFPEEANLLFQHKKTQMLEAAQKAQSVTPIFKEIDKLSPEVREIMFTPHELEKIRVGKKYLETVSYSRNPSFGNPSRTAYTESMIDAFQSPKAALTGWARDAAIKKFVETGNAGFDKGMVSTLKSLEGAAQKITTSISSAVKTFLSKAAPVAAYTGSKSFIPEKEEKREDKFKTFEKQSKEVMDAVQNPEALTDKATEAFQGIAEHAPKIAAAAAQKAVLGATFLFDKMPKNPNSADNIFSNKAWKPSDYEISKWMKFVDTVDNPMGAFKDLKHGKMTVEQSETLKTVYPEIYQETVKNIMEELPKLKEELPYQKRLQLGILFQIPTDPSLKPAFIAQMQAAHMEAGQAQAASQGGGGGKVSASRANKLNFADNNQTNTQRVMTRS